MKGSAINSCSKPCLQHLHIFDHSQRTVSAWSQRTFKCHLKVLAVSKLCVILVFNSKQSQINPENLFTLAKYFLHFTFVTK